MRSETSLHSNQAQISQWLWIVPILLLAFGLTVPHFMQDAVWFDEAYTHLFSGTGRLPSMPIIDSLLLIAKTDTWPPGYYLLNMVWGYIMGSAHIVAYVLPALLGLLGISVFYQVGKHFYSQKGGIIASLMLATSAFYLHYFHEIRGYTLYVLAVATMLLFYRVLISRINYRRRWHRWGFPIAIAASIYTHNVAGAFIAGLMVYHLLMEYPSRSQQAHMNQKRWLDTIRLWINGCLLFAPWFAMLLGTIVFESKDDRALPFFELLTLAVQLFSNNLLWIFLPLIIASLLLWKLPQIRFLWIWLLSSLVFVIIINAIASFLFHPRHIIPFLLIFILMLVPVLMEIDKRIRGLSTIFIGLYAGAGIVFSFSPVFMAQIPTGIPLIPLVSILEMEEAVEQCVQEDDAVIYALSEAEAEWIHSIVIQYYDLKDVKQYSQLGELTATVNNDFTSWQLLDNLEASRTIMDFANGNDTIWLMRLPDLANQSNIMLLDSVLTEQNNYRKCPALETRENADIWSYTRGENICNLSC